MVGEKAMKVLLEDINGNKQWVEQTDSEVLTPEEVQSMNMKITPELLERFGDNDAQKFHNMLENGELQR